MKQRVLLVGRDAQDLLHRISTADVKKIAKSSQITALFLNPQGKILSSFELKKVDESSAEIEFEAPFLEILDQFTFSEKYQINPLPIDPENHSEKTETEVERILAIKPKLGHEFFHDGKTNPLEVNLRNSIHDNKGCYPGQEVIEKIISLGSPARNLCLIETHQNFKLLSNFSTPLPLYDSSVPSDSSSESSAVAELTSYASTKAQGIEMGIALAIVKRTHLKEGTSFTTRGQNPEIQFILKKVSS